MHFVKNLSLFVNKAGKIDGFQHQNFPNYKRSKRMKETYLSLMKYTPEIRFADIDSYGIVHNAKYLIFFEQSRIRMFNKIAGNWNWERSGVLVANQKVDYRHPVRLNDNLEILVWIKSVGEKSLIISYEAHIITESKTILSAESETVIVCYDPSTKSSVNVPKIWRKSIDKHGLLGKPLTC